MLTKTLLSCVLLPLLVGCGSSSSVFSDTASAGPSDEAECTKAASDPNVLGDSATVEFIESKSANVEMLNEWFRSRAKEFGGPVIEVNAYDDLSDVGEDDVFSVCLYKGEPRPIPVPEGAKSTEANGVTSLVLNGSVTVIALGPLESLRDEFALLEG